MVSVFHLIPISFGYTKKISNTSAGYAAYASAAPCIACPIAVLYPDK